MMNKKFKQIFSILTVCSLVLTFAIFTVAVDEDEPQDPIVTDDVTEDTTTAPPAVESIEFATASYTLSKGDSVATELIVMPEGVEDYEIEYSTSNKKVALVNKDGVITAVGKGDAVITATCGELTCKTKVTVTYIELSIEQDHTKEKYVSGFSLGMTVESAKAAFAKYNNLAVEDLKILSDSSEVSASALIATGMVIEEGEGVYYNVVVFGDVDGSGTITYDDTRTVINVLAGGAFDNPACERAAKFNGNDKLSVKTALDMSDYVSGRLKLD